MADLDPMDARLREYADRWRASSVPPAPAVPFDRLTSRRRAARAWWLTAASAAAVAAVIVGATQLVGDDNRKPPPPAHTVKPTGVVPWAPLPPTHPTIPTTTSASPDPEAAGKPECRASDLRATGRPGAAAGTYYLTVRLVLVGDQPCRLEGYPDLEPLNAGHPVAIPVEHRTDSNLYEHPVLVAAGRAASVRLAWTSNWCAPAVHNDTIRMLLPGGGSLSFQGLGGSQCYGTPGSGTKAPIEVGTFEPAKVRAGHARTAYAGVAVSGYLNMNVTPAQTVPFTITLTSPTDLPLDPCPDYRIVQVAENGEHDQSYGLNCAAVPFKDSRGRPYLPAGTPVRFEMRTTVTGSWATAEKLSWVLDTVDARGTSGTLTVTGPTPSSPATPAETAEQRAAVHAGVATIQAFLDTWRRDGLTAASHAYAVPDQQTSSDIATPHLTAGSVGGAVLSSWRSADDFVLEVSLELHFEGNRYAWNEGENGRFVTLTRTDGALRLSFATSP
ncbi:MAG TPA: DUF4232 domain-containing protein [Marmoricola sp.]|nr:DUF4232 domain-containing protein [Marmoricola sp.]